MLEAGDALFVLFLQAEAAPPEETHPALESDLLTMAQVEQGGASLGVIREPLDHRGQGCHTNWTIWNRQAASTTPGAPDFRLGARDGQD